MDLAWDSVPGEGATCMVVFTKDGNVTSWRDVDAAQASGGGASSITLTTDTGDLVLMYDQKYGSTAPTLPSGFTNGNTTSNNSEAARLSYIVATGATQVCTSQAVDYSTVVAVSIPSIGGGMAANASDQATASAALSTQARLQASGNSLSSATAALTASAILNVNQWQQISGGTLAYPIVANEWSTGERRGIRDNVTGELLMWGGGPSKQFRLYRSEDGGATWTVVATDVTNPTGGFGYPNRVLGVAQDSSGKVHLHCRGTDSDQEHYYLRLSLTRSGGHVTNHTIEQTPIAFPSRNAFTNPDPRGDIKVVMVGGQERIVWCSLVYTTASQNTTLVSYAGISTTITPTSSAHFVGLNGSGSDTKIIDGGGDTDYSSHLHEVLIVQNPASEDVYFVCGFLNGDYSQVVGSGAAYDLFALRYPVSGSYLGTSSTITIATETDHAPYLMSVHGDGSRAWVMYMHPDNGVSFGYFNTSGTFVAGPASPLSTADRAGFGGFSTNGDRIWAIYQTYGNSATGIVNHAAYYDGTWNITSLTSAADCNGYGCIQWSAGVAVIRWTGDLPPQNQDDVHTASIWSAPVSAALAATANSLATASAGLTTAIRVAATAADVASGSAGLTTGIPLQGSASDTASATAGLSTAIRLALNALTQASMSGALTTSILLAGSAQNIVSASGSLGGSSAQLAAAAADVVNATGSLLTGIAMRGDAITVVTASGALVSGSLLGATGQVTASGSASLSTGISLSAAAVDVVTASGAIVTGIPLMAGAESVASSTAGLGTAIQLTATASAVSQVVAGLVTEIRMVGAALSQANASGSLNSGAMLNAAASNAALATGDLSTLIQLLAGAQAQATASASMSSGIALRANAASESAASAEISGAAASLVAAAQSIVTALASLTLGLPLAADAQATSAATAALSASIRLFGMAESAATASAVLNAVAKLYASALTIRAPARDYTIRAERRDYTVHI